MSAVVVEVGPATVNGPNDVDHELVSVAIDGIEDDLVLVGERAVETEQVWRDIVASAAGPGAEKIILVCPTWWPGTWVQRVWAAAHAVADTTMIRRSTALSSRRCALVEIAEQLIAVTRRDGGVAVVARGGDPDEDAAAVDTAVGVSAAVLIDAPEAVRAEPVATLVGRRLRARGVEATVATVDAVRLGVASAVEPAEDVPARFGSPRTLVAGLIAAVLLCGGFAVRSPDGGDIPTTLLVEGRVGVTVPATWSTRRITSGPGSARVQVVSPSDAVALHITQSAAPPAGLAAAADILRAALDDEPDGVFVDFKPSDRRADRRVITYRELRRDRHVEWFVLVDGAVRIAIGCESAPGRADAVREPCERAIRSAHAIF